MTKKGNASRNLDLIREILMRLETLSYPPNSKINIDVGECMELEFTDTGPDIIFHQLKILIDGGFINASSTGGGILFSSISWKGHEYLDSVRNPETWSKTKEIAKGAGGAGLEVVWEIAKSVVKKEAGRLLGYPL